MKTFTLSLICASLFLLFSPESKAQCNVELYITKSMRDLSPGFQFLKSFRIDGNRGHRKIEYTCVLAKHTKYQFRIKAKDGSTHGIIGTLYDSKRNRIVTNFYQNKFLPGWIFECKSTGIYYLNFTFKDSQSFCGAAVMGFKRSYDEGSE